MILLIFVGIFLALAGLAVALIWRIGKTARLMHDTRVGKARSDARAEAAEETTGRLFGVTETALKRAETIEEVRDTMNELLGIVGDDPARGKHAANLRIVPGSGEEYVA